MKTTKKKTVLKASAEAPAPVALAECGVAREPTVAERMAEVSKHLGAVSLAASMEGNEEAARAIVSVAASLCGDVADIVLCQPKVAAAIARERMNWPLLCGIHPEIFARNTRYLKLLPLGEAAIWKTWGRKARSFKTPENWTVQLALITLRGKPTVSAVVKEAERTVMANKEHPLRVKGETWARTAARRVGAHSHTPEAFENNVRTRVRELLRNAARELLNVPPE